MRYDTHDWIMIIFAAAFVIFAVYACVAGQREADRQAVIRHRCTPVRHVAGQAVVVSTPQGVGVGGTSEQTCYRCPDGMEECF